MRQKACTADAAAMVAGTFAYSHWALFPFSHSDDSHSLHASEGRLLKGSEKRGGGGGGGMAQASYPMWCEVRSASFCL